MEQDVQPHLINVDNVGCCELLHSGIPMEGFETGQPVPL